MRNFLKTRAVTAVATAFTSLFSGVATAEPPMWLIEDEDSTIYLFGTVHVLDPAIEWQTERVIAALDEATELWLEVPIPASIPELQALQGPIMVQRAISPGRPLSGLLTDEEQAQLERALARTPEPEQLGLALENMKPWFSLITLSVGPLLNAGYDAGAGADMVLARLAHGQGDEVLGFETLEQQIDLFSGWTEEQQLAALRAFLAVPDEEIEASIAVADAAFRAWMSGDISLVVALIEEWRTGEDSLRSTTIPYDMFVADRNADWAVQIEELLGGSGVAFIAVGAGHLVGPDSVRAKLSERGITISTY